MKLTGFDAHKSWLMPAILVLAVTCLVYAIVGCFATRPLPWIVLIPGSLPLSMYIFVGRPLLKKETRSPRI
jgi:hypothetical protein